MSPSEAVGNFVDRAPSVHKMRFSGVSLIPEVVRVPSEREESSKNLLALLELLLVLVGHLGVHDLVRFVARQGLADLGSSRNDALADALGFGTVVGVGLEA